MGNEQMGGRMGELFTTMVLWGLPSESTQLKSIVISWSKLLPFLQEYWNVDIAALVCRILHESAI